MLVLKNVLPIIVITMISCLTMAVVDGIIMPNYMIKSFIKIIMFLMIPLLYSLLNKSRTTSFKEMLKLNKNGLIRALILGIGVYVLIVGGYFLLQNVFDWSNITKSLSENIGVNKDNFLFVSIYISFINSFLEELFFRGFIFVNLKKLGIRKIAYIFSAIMFALYHVAMMINWFSIGLYLIIIFGLFIGGLLFNYLNAKNDTIYVSWITHMFANFAINTVGFILFN